MRDKKITIKTIRSIYFDLKKSLPRNNILKDIVDIADSFGVDLFKLNKFERNYIITNINACLGYLRKISRQSGLNWIDVKTEDMKYTLHGFSNDIDYINNSIERIIQRTDKMIAIKKQAVNISNDQLKMISQTKEVSK